MQVEDVSYPSMPDTMTPLTYPGVHRDIRGQDFGTTFLCIPAHFESIGLSSSGGTVESILVQRDASATGTY